MLTGILNRKAFEARLKRAVAQSRNDSAMVVSVLLLDVDHFEHFGDTNGHRIGDLVLRLVAPAGGEREGPRHGSLLRR